MSAQKEIIHLSFGTFSNHLSTHFWNQQVSYFTYDDCDNTNDSESSSLVNHDVSFRLGQTMNGKETFTPRVLLFDVRQEFGSLGILNPLYRSIQTDHDGQQDSLLTQEAIGLWGSNVDVVREKRVIPSRYQTRLEREQEEGITIDSEDDDYDDDEEEKEEEEKEEEEAKPGTSTQPRSKPIRKTTKSTKYRFWSDYSRVYYHPKSMVHVGGQLMAPMSGSYNGSNEGEEGEEENDARTRFERFEQGYGYFDQLENESEIVEGNLRWFTEDTDLLQGFQYTINTSDGFSGLGYRFLEHLVDEYPKVSHLVAATTWGDHVAETRLARIRRMNHALLIVMLGQQASLLVPILPPKQKPKPSPNLESNWSSHLDRIQLDDMHHTAALVAAHWETATLGSRLRSKPESLASLVARLNWRKDTKLAHLGGCFPLSIQTSLSLHHPNDPVDAMFASYGYPSRRRCPPSTSQLAETNASLLKQTWLDLSIPDPIRLSKHEQLIKNRLQSPFASTVMARDDDAVFPTLSAVDRLIQLKQPLSKGLLVPIPFHLPTSFPNFFNDLSSQGRPNPTSSSSSLTRPTSIPTISSLSTTSSTTYLLETVLKTFQNAIQGHLPLCSHGLQSYDKDELREFYESVQHCFDSYNVDGDVGLDEVGTDEEEGVDDDDEYGFDLDLQYQFLFHFNFFMGGGGEGRRKEKEADRIHTNSYCDYSDVHAATNG